MTVYNLHQFLLACWFALNVNSDRRLIHNDKLFLGNFCQQEASGHYFVCTDKAS